MDCEFEEVQEGDDIRLFKIVRRFTHICLDCERCFANIRNLREHWLTSCGSVDELSDGDEGDIEEQDYEDRSDQGDGDDSSRTSTDSSD